MELKREIKILGRKVEIALRAKDKLKGITVGEKQSYNFYDGIYQGTSLLFVEPKKGNPTPRECDITMTNTVVRPRATHDIDMIVIVENMTKAFANQLRYVFANEHQDFSHDRHLTI